MQNNDQDFIQYLTIKKKLSDNSVRTYSGRFNIIKRWLVETNTELTKQSVENFLYDKKEKEKLSNAAVNTYIQTLNHIQDFLKDRGTPSNFMEGIVSLPKTQPEIDILSEEEINSLLNTHLDYKNRNGVICNDLDHKYLTITTFIALTGVRFDEAASLKVKRLDLGNGRARIVNTKNKQNRFVFCDTPPIKELLRKTIEGKQSEDLVFTNSKNEKIKPGEFNNDLRRRARKAGIINYERVHAHLLRHSFATHLYISTHDITSVATILGHKDIQTTFQTYVHLDTDTLQKATRRHPLLRAYTDPKETLSDVRSAIESFKINTDKRFTYSIYLSDNGMDIKIHIV